MVGCHGPPSSPQQDNILIDRLASAGTFIFQREMRGGGKQGDEMRQRVGGVEMFGAYGLLLFVVIPVIIGLTKHPGFKLSKRYDGWTK